MKRRKSLKQIRARLILCGYTLRSWAIKHGYRPSTVYGAARGERAGVKSMEILRKLEELTNGKRN